MIRIFRQGMKKGGNRGLRKKKRMETTHPRINSPKSALPCKKLLQSQKNDFLQIILLITEEIIHIFKYIATFEKAV
jgi:hypothetical protein